MCTASAMSFKIVVIGFSAPASYTNCKLEIYQPVFAVPFDHNVRDPIRASQQTVILWRVAISMSRQNFFFCPKPEKPEKTGKTEPKPDKTF